jgi:hypothetical protein
MRFSKGWTLVLCLLVAALFVATTFAQETTGGMQGTVKDPQGAVVPKATVEVASPALIGVKKLETDNGGYYRFSNLPPGAYTITVTAQGFRSLKQSGVNLEVGKLPTIDLTLQVGGTEQTIEVSSQAPIVDVAQSKVQTNITEDVLNSIPKGASYQSVIQFAPGARSEPLQGGYQIDGASNSENAYLVEGQETASVFDGSTAANVPTEFIQEVQIKTSGFEAEFGGALGGVVNVIQKRGGNAWHGSVFTYFQGDLFEAAPDRQRRYDPQKGTNGGHSTAHYLSDGVTVNPNWCGLFQSCLLDQPIQFYQPKKDHYRYLTPGFEVGGYLVKDRLWLFSSFAPELQNTERDIHFNIPGNINQSPFSGTRPLHYTQNTYYSLERLDYLLTQNIRLYGAYQYNYQRGTGASTTSPLPNADDAYGLYNPVSGIHPDNYNGGIGYVAPNSITNIGADITITPNLVATTRYGYFFTNYADRGLGVGDRYYYRDTNYNYSTANVPANLTASGCTVAGCGNIALDGTALNTVNNGKFVSPTGFFNIPVNSTTFFNAFKRYSFNQDLAYFKKAFGTHNFKFGYAYNRGSNDVLTNYNTADLYIGYNMEYAPNTTGGQDNCSAIIAQNQAWWGKAGGAADGSSCQGNWGTINLRDLLTQGKVAGNNHALYAQDAWTIGTKLTLNLGVRTDKEYLPPYETGSGFQGIGFGFGQKVAPRLGASYDVFGNGKLKMYGSFGYFYDIMKYNLPRGSFGGDYWHDCVYALDTPNYTLFAPQRDAAGHYCPTGGQVGASGTVPGVTTGPTNLGARFIENYDYRQPSNDPASPGSLGKTGLVDPNLKPMKQHEMVVGADWAMTPTFAFETRYSRKRLDRTIEDTGVITQDGEQYYISNPGEGADAKVPSYECTTCVANPKANRSYDGIEFRFTKRPGASNWFGSLAYTYSRLYGNYSGLTATDVSDGGGARNGANADRAFDEPFMQFDAHGKVVDGPLATDRPNSFKGYGYYKLKWFGHETLLGGYQQWYSGTPLSSYISVWGAPVFVEGRGKFANVTRDASGNWVLNGVSSKRTPTYSQTDLSLVQDFHVSKTNEKLVLGFEANVFNVFNQHSVTLIGQNLIRTSGVNPDRCSVTGSCPATSISGIDYAKLLQGYDYIAAANSQSRIFNSQYGVPFGWQSPRTMRFKLKFAF